jgi:peptidoglycan hydrolase-like protein with peptidoglycan-binding domain
VIPTALRTLAALALAALASCRADDPQRASAAMEKRMRDIERLAKESIPKTQEIALAQTVDPAVVTRAQQALVALKEYMDPPSGKIDDVTVNAIMAFQRRAGLEDDGLLNEKTLERLDEAASQTPR